MGLPIWRSPEDWKASKDAIKTDPTAAARSSIRRRPSIHGRRSSRPRLNRDSTVQLPRVERSPPPSVGFNGLRDSRRNAMRAGVPPISTLLESADRHGAAPPPPPVPESRNYYDQGAEEGQGSDESEWEPGERQLRDSIARLSATAGRLERQTQVMRDRLTHARSEGQTGQRSGGGSAPQVSSQPSRRLPRPSSGMQGQWVREDGRPTRSQERANRARRATLPTPPLEPSDPEGDSLFLPEARATSTRGSHPLSNSWSPDSPVDGLGDRNRSPTPADGWEIMRATITPDATLPSADSSFTSAAASQSFTSANNATITEPEPVSSSFSNSRRNSSDSSDGESVSSLDPDDLVCDDENATGGEALAAHMYDVAMGDVEGRERIRRLRALRDREGHGAGLAHESERIDIGYGLIEEALHSNEGSYEDSLRRHRDFRAPYGQIRGPTGRGARITDAQPPSPNPDRYSEDTRSAAREATAQVHDYFRRYTADALYPRSRSPPPQYEPLASHPDVDTFISRDGPEPNPVSPPTQRSQHEVADALLSGDDADLGAMRRVVERLARRDDVPDEWWSSIGLNLSRTRPRALSPLRSERIPEPAAGNRVRAGRIERRNSRL